MGCFRPKYIVLELRKYRRVIFDGTQDSYKWWRKTDLFFQKWHDEFDKFSLEHARNSKNWDSFWILLPKVENIWVENLQESCVSWQWIMIQNSTVIDLPVQNWHEESDEF